MERGGLAMADEQADGGAAEGAEAIAAPKGKLKLIIAAVGVLALVACSRHRVEEFFEDGKGYLGMAQYETRSWVGWHHHMTLVGLAHLFVTLARLRLKKKSRS